MTSKYDIYRMNYIEAFGGHNEHYNYSEGGQHSSPATTPPGKIDLKSINAGDGSLYLTWMPPNNGGRRASNAHLGAIS